MKNNEDSGFKAAAPYLGLGWQMVITILLGIAIGYYLDKYFETKQIFSIICSIIFILLALYNFIRTVINLDKKNDSKKVK